MNLLIIGGTGRTGKELIKQALERNHEVTALVRTPKKLRTQHPNLTITKGNILDPTTFKDCFQNKDAVLSCLGHKRFFVKTSILSKGTKNIIEAMEINGIKRFICITSLGVNDSRFKLGIYYTLFTIPFILWYYFKDKEKQEKLIKASSLDWTIVRPAQLINGRKRMKFKQGTETGHYIITKLISRADVAYFMLNELENNNYIKKAPGIHY